MCLGDEAPSRRASVLTNSGKDTQTIMWAASSRAAMVMVSIYRSDFGLSTQSVMDPENAYFKNFLVPQKLSHVGKTAVDARHAVLGACWNISTNERQRQPKEKVEEESRSQNEPWHVQVI